MPPRDPLREFVGESDGAERVRDVARRAAGAAAPVLIEGETGTGKSLLARLIHAASARARGGFVPINCAGLPDALFESELFGHEEGAFTGAQRARPGLFQLADGGTLFLDEVGSLPRSQQAKFLLALDDGEVRRVGGRKPQRVDVRVVSASSGSLGARVVSGEFRSDLLFRLALLCIRIPPLRERREDIPPLARVLADRAGRRFVGRGGSVSEAGVELLLGLDWPGNVRELRFVLEAAVVLTGAERISVEALEEALEHSAASVLRAEASGPGPS